MMSFDSLSHIQAVTFSHEERTPSGGRGRPRSQGVVIHGRIKLRPNAQSADFRWHGKNKGGYLYDVSPVLFFPAAGQRSVDGNFWGVADHGYYWSASAAYYSNESHFLYFNSTPGHCLWEAGYRANGLPVRAVVEE